MFWRSIVSSRIFPPELASTIKTSHSQFSCLLSQCQMFQNFNLQNMTVKVSDNSKLQTEIYILFKPLHENVSISTCSPHTLSNLLWNIKFQTILSPISNWISNIKFQTDIISDFKIKFGHEIWLKFKQCYLQFV